MESSRPEGTRPKITLAVTQGIVRLCHEMDWMPLTEVTFKNQRRADVLALDKAGKFHLFEVKSSKEDYLVDQKWQDYLDFCDTFSFAVAQDFPMDLIPADVGLTICDQYGWHQARPPYQSPLHASRRKAMTLMFARLAAKRLLESPNVSSLQSN